ncbi:hypothetical protein ACIBKX_40665 [Streptomyces sp. NPDC050658]|uniref:hypothetical protein n=1 Tax=unclassified Streptomyces TaxID=2593676 RepID=UPI003445BB0F
MSQEIKRGEVWSLTVGRDVLIISRTGLDEAYGAVLAIVLHPPGRYPDTAMSVELSAPVQGTAVAVNIQQLRTTRFEEATRRGDVGPDVMARINAALRAVQDL